MILSPQDPIAAVTHPDPYPYYAELVASRPIYRDDAAGIWIASSAATVTAVLTSALYRVRPLTEQVPTALLGSPAGQIFRRLVRMNDGHMHGPMKGAISATLSAIGADEVAEQSRKWARFLADDIEPKAHPDGLTDFAFQLSVYVIASLLGIPQEEMRHTAVWTRDFVQCLAPGSSPEQIEQGKVAARHLLDLVHTCLSTQDTQPTEHVLGILAHEARSVGCVDTDTVVANGIGLLSQAYEATAGLIGNTLLALASHPDVYEQVLADRDLLRLVIEEVLRYDPPVQNTRRYLVRNGRIADNEMNEGDTVLVVLAAANRDPAANPSPERFDIFRKARRHFTFGTGIHGCPGETVATVIARAGIEQLILSGINVPHLVAPLRYRPSVNVRVPLFERGES